MATRMESNDKISVFEVGGRSCGCWLPKGVSGGVLVVNNGEGGSKVYN